MSTIARLRWWLAGFIVNHFCKEHKDWYGTKRFKFANWVCPGGIPDSW